MRYGTKFFKTGKKTGYLQFDTGKKVLLNTEEVKEMDNKIREYRFAATELCATQNDCSKYDCSK